MYVWSPTLCTSMRACPAMTKLPDKTVAPSCFSIESLSPVSIASEHSTMPCTIVPSHGIWSPARSTRMSPLAMSSIAIFCSWPSRMTHASSWWMRASLSSTCLERTSCTMLMTMLERTTPKKSMLRYDPVMNTSAASAKFTMLKNVNVFCKKIVLYERLDSSLILFFSLLRASSVVKPCLGSVLFMRPF